MGRTALVRSGLVLLATMLPVSAAAQQTFESLGSRALGMGGAFVAVADDPSAVYWNPAGLASGQPAGLTLEWIRFRSGDRDLVPGAGPWQRSARFMSLGTWPVGLSYASFDETRLVDGPADELRVRRLLTKHYSATVLQTLTEGLVVGTTLKYVRGTVAAGSVTDATVGKALDSGKDQTSQSSGTFDLDASLMYDARVFRLGWTMRNLRSPRFEGPEETAIKLNRLSRVGLAILPADGFILAVDLDLNAVDLPDGRRRMLAVGMEHKFLPKLVLRGGVRRNLEGAHATVGSVGASFALSPGAWLDGHVTHGRANGERGFGLALRAGW